VRSVASVGRRPAFWLVGMVEIEGGRHHRGRRGEGVCLWRSVVVSPPVVNGLHLGHVSAGRKDWDWHKEAGVLEVTHFS
jgi:hypothetical protein